MHILPRSTSTAAAPYCTIPNTNLNPQKQSPPLSTWTRNLCRSRHLPFPFAAPPAPSGGLSGPPSRNSLGLSAGSQTSAFLWLPAKWTRTCPSAALTTVPEKHRSDGRIPNSSARRRSWAAAPAFSFSSLLFPPPLLPSAFTKHRTGVPVTRKTEGRAVSASRQSSTSFAFPAFLAFFRGRSRLSSSGLFFTSSRRTSTTIPFFGFFDPSPSSPAAPGASPPVAASFACLILLASYLAHSL
mmetsp:Transcript_7300/g.13298  ORF Transcript_7300/g.13298 Transcript_7300/m.13298 type:complete len:241 (+) Transcript_7300:617-1339(+)